MNGELWGGARGRPSQKNLMSYALCRRPFRFPNLLFVIPGASTLVSWGTWDDPEAVGSTRKDTLKSRLGFSIDLSGGW